MAHLSTHKKKPHFQVFLCAERRLAADAPQNSGAAAPGALHWPGLRLSPGPGQGRPPRPAPAAAGQRTEPGAGAGCRGVPGSLSLSGSMSPFLSVSTSLSVSVSPSLSLSMSVFMSMSMSKFISVSKPKLPTSAGIRGVSRILPALRDARALSANPQLAAKQDVGGALQHLATLTGMRDFRRREFLGDYTL